MGERGEIEYKICWINPFCLRNRVQKGQKNEEENQPASRDVYAFEELVEVDEIRKEKPNLL